MFTLNDALAKKLIDARFDYSVYARSLKFARKFHQEDELASLMDLRHTADILLTKIHTEVYQEMRRNGTNTCDLSAAHPFGEGWYAIAVVERKAKVTIAVEAVEPDGLILLERGRPVTRMDFDKHIKNITDAHLLSEYKAILENRIAVFLAETYGLEYTSSEELEKVSGESYDSCAFADDQAQCKQAIQPCAGVEVIAVIDEVTAMPVCYETLHLAGRLPEADGTPGITDHALERWIERVEGVMSKEQIRLLRIQKEVTYVKQMKAAWRKSTLEHEEQDGTHWYYNKLLNLFFIVCGTRPHDSTQGKAIVTLYEKEFQQTQDFSFSKDLNKTIVQKQLQVIRRMKKSFAKLTALHQASLDSTDEEIMGLRKEQSVIAKRIAELEKDKKEKQTKIGISSKALDEELAKIFYKKWLKKR